MLPLSTIFLKLLSPFHFTYSFFHLLIFLSLFIPLLPPHLFFVSISLDCLPSLPVTFHLIFYLPLQSLPPLPPLPFTHLRPSPSISSSSRRRHDSEEGDSHRRHKHKKSKRSKEGKEANEDISADQENQEAME